MGNAYSGYGGTPEQAICSLAFVLREAGYAVDAFGWYTNFAHDSNKSYPAIHFSEQRHWYEVVFYGGGKRGVNAYVKAQIGRIFYVRERSVAKPISIYKFDKNNWIGSKDIISIEGEREEFIERLSRLREPLGFSLF